MANRRYQIGTQAIDLPPDHLLPQFQGQHPLYDRFPSFLASLCRKDQWILDIGANVGDTTAAMVQNTEGQVLAIEGHAPFFELLVHNTNLLATEMQDRIRSVQALVGTRQVSGTLIESNGTATFVEGGENRFSRLDDILDREQITVQSVAVLKTDTDGHDPDVILSASQLLAAGSPVLYFENQFENDQQLGQFEEMYAAIGTHGYKLFSVFDNFGNLLLDIAPPYFVSSLNKYLKAQNLGKATRTVYYYDVLAFKEGSAEAVAMLLSNYRKAVFTD